MAKRVIETLVTEMRADTSSMRRALEKNVRDTEQWGRKTKSLVVGALAGFGAVSFVKNVVDATRTQEDALRQMQQGLITTNNAVGLSFDELVKNATELQKVTTLGDEEVIKAQSQLLTFTKITGDQFLKTTELAADLSARMGTDLNSSVLQLGKALNDPVKNLSALSRAGIQFDDDQKALIKTLVESGRMADAQNVILGELETQFGGSARAARDTFGGALSGLSNALGDLLEADGASLPGAKNAIEELTAELSDPETIKAAQSLASAVIAAFTGISKAITTTVNVTRFLGEELAAAVHGPAVGDMVRLTDELSEAEKRLADIKSSKVSTGMEGIAVVELEKEIAALNEKIRITRELEAMGGGATGVGSSNSEPSAPATSSSGSIGVIASPAGEKLEASLQRQIALFGETSQAAKLRYDLEHGLINDLDSKQHDSLLAAAEQLDALATKKRLLDEEEAERKALLNDVTLLEERLLTEEETMLLAYERRHEMLENALQQNLISKKKFNDLEVRLERDKDKERRKIVASGFSTLLDIAGSYYDGVQGKEAARVRMALSLGKALLDEEKRNSLKRIAINTYDAAMGAYKAMSGIPYIGPVLGVAAAGVVIAAGAAYAANVAGIAHGGLDSVPSESTYLLDKGERVVSPRQNRDLTDFLADPRGKGGGDVQVVVNEAPGVTNEIDIEKDNGKTVVTINQTIRDIVRDELFNQQAPGGLLDQSYAI